MRFMFIVNTPAALKRLVAEYGLPHEAPVYLAIAFEAHWQTGDRKKFRKLFERYVDNLPPSRLLPKSLPWSVPDRMLYLLFIKILRDEMMKMLDCFNFRSTVVLEHAYAKGNSVVLEFNDGYSSLCEELLLL